MMGRMTIFPSTTTGLSLIACMPKTAAWGVLIIGVPYREPNTPPFEL